LKAVKGVSVRKMSTWNYRVIENDGVFAIHEAYYDDAGKVITIAVESVAPLGESLAELRADLEYYNQALARPVLRYEDFIESVPERLAPDQDISSAS
jgi:hypothetical protein